MIQIDRSPMEMLENYSMLNVDFRVELIFDTKLVMFAVYYMKQLDIRDVLIH